jgi:beta-phosphoglucomutase-like phosphatase (HAD superfamily)
VHAALRAVVGDELAAAFAVLAGDVVAPKKPAPDIDLYPLKQLAMSAENALVIEHSRSGILAATAARLGCIVTPSTFTTSLGDPSGEPSRIVANRARIHIDDHVRTGDLARCLSHRRAQSFFGKSVAPSVPGTSRDMQR